MITDNTVGMAEAVFVGRVEEDSRISAARYIKDWEEAKYVLSLTVVFVLLALVFFSGFACVESWFCCFFSVRGVRAGLAGGRTTYDVLT